MAFEGTWRTLLGRNQGRASARLRAFCDAIPRRGATLLCQAAVRHRESTLMHRHMVSKDEKFLRNLCTWP